ncbi:hypothetical protein EMMF5_001036 [Cystobasidiomycetes sp. EMM_F5]
MPACLGQREAQQLDVDLMSEEGGFRLEQLMELAGLSCAQALQDAYPDLKQFSRILTAVTFAFRAKTKGGDGLVAARHLWHFGYKPSLYYPKQGGNAFYQSLKKQCQQLAIPIVEATEQAFCHALQQSDLVMDAVFGFSFSGEPRPPFDTVLSELRRTTKPIVSVDIPSGWDVEKGDPEGRFFTPSVLVSLTAPKQGCKAFQGKHYLGGRFIPPSIASKYNLDPPPYKGSSQIAEL